MLSLLASFFFLISGFKSVFVVLCCVETGS